MSERSINAQAVAVERALLSVRGHRDVIAGLVARGKRPAHELVTLERWLVDLAPAAATMQWLASNEDEVRAALALKSSLLPGGERVARAARRVRGSRSLVSGSQSPSPRPSPLRGEGAQEAQTLFSDGTLARRVR
jgi:hypothetical protein